MQIGSLPGGGGKGGLFVSIYSHCQPLLTLTAWAGQVCVLSR